MLRDIAGKIVQEQDSLIEKIADAFITQIPVYASISSTARRELTDSLRALILLIGKFLLAGGEDQKEAFAYARRVSEARFIQNIPFGELVRSYYIGEEVVWNELVQYLKEQDHSLDDWVKLFSIKSSLEADLISALSSSYMAEKDLYINRRLRELTAMIEVGKTIAASIQLDVVLRQILEVSTSLMQVNMGAVFFLQEETGDLQLEAALGLPRPWVKGLTVDLSRSLLRVALEKKKPEAANSERLEGLQLPSFAGGKTINSLISCPILLGDTPIGGIELYDLRTRSFQPLDLVLLSTFASQAGVAIQNARLFGRERRRREQALSAKEMAEDIARSINLYQALGIVVHNLATIAGVDRCTLYHYYADTGEIEFVRGFGLREKERKILKGMRTRVSDIDEMTRAAVEDKEIVIVHDASSDSRASRESVELFNIQSCLLAPLVFKDQVTGLVVLDHTRRKHYFDQNEVEMIRAAASQAAQAIEQVKLRESIHQKEMALQQAQVNLEVFKERERSEAIINANPDAIMLVSRDFNVMSFNPAAETLTGWRAGEAIGRSCCEILNGRLPDPGVCRRGDCPIARSIQGDTSPLKEMLYTRRDGTQVWIGGSFSVLRNPKRHIENVVAVFRDISEQKRLEHMAIVEKELEIARNTQSALLPADSLDHARVKIKCRQEQARLVGGDWYDYWIDGNRLILVIGDAAGSGMPAALMATLAMSAIRAEAHRSSNILEIIQRVNKSILPNQMEDNFLTVFYSEINLDDLTMRYLNAGHYDPLWVREGRNSQFLPSKERLILGAFDMPDLKVEEVKLQAGDRLILYTDGLIESRNSHHVLFGLNRLVRYINANSTRSRDTLIDELYSRLLDFTGKTFDDDITMLVCDLL